MQKETLEKIEIISKIIRNLVFTLAIPLFLYHGFCEAQLHLKHQRITKEKTITQKILKKGNDKIELIKEGILNKLLEGLKQ
ncbi:MAG: hypothetical protein VYD54_05260 [Bdellovibrionota bacterium]|nr:hypothetical protein [Bdellovibrionota bacterium]